MLGLRPYRLGDLRQDVAQASAIALHEIASLQARGDAVYAAGLLLPPAYRAPMIEEATGLRAEMASLKETLSGPVMSLEYRDAHARLGTLPEDLAALEAALAQAADAAYRGAPVRRAQGAGADSSVPGTNLAKIGLGVGALGVLGLGIWAAVG